MYVCYVQLTIRIVGW